jgi:two-component system sensor histidine kinase DegS
MKDQRIAQELRENILQNLAALNLSIEAAVRDQTRKPAETSRFLKDVQQRINQNIQGIRQLSQQFRSEVLEYLDLAEALEAMVEEMQADFHIKIGYTTRGIERDVPAIEKIGLYHAAQEALKNACQHSGASKIHLMLCFYTRKIKLRISDNGQGFEAPDQLLRFAGSGKMGLINIENWTLSLGGKMWLQSSVNGGTVITIEVPV